MAVAEVDFKQALMNFPGGVTVITAADAAGRPVGATVSSFASLSLQPPLVVACLRLESRSVQAIRNSGAFAVHILAAGQADLARRFASDAADKFAGLAYEVSDRGVPYLRDCARLDCDLEDEYPGGDHSIVIGRVTAVHVVEGFEPLVYARRGFFALGRAVG